MIEGSSRGQIFKSTKSSITTILKNVKIKIKAEQLVFKQLSKLEVKFTFLIFYQSPQTLIDPGADLQLEMVYHAMTLSGQLIIVSNLCSSLLLFSVI